MQIVTAPFVPEERKILKSEKERVLKSVCWVFFGCYIIGLVYFMFFSEKYGRTIPNRDYSYNLVFFKEIKRFIQYRKLLGSGAVITNLVGNITAFVPFGLFLPILSKKSRGFLTITLLTAELSLLIELTQLVTKVGIFDVDDLFMNTCGGAIGYLIFFGVYRYRRRKNE